MHANFYLFSQFNLKSIEFMERGVYESDIKNKPNKAIKYFSRALELDSNYYPALYKRAHVYNSLNQFNEAISDLNRVIKLMNFEDKKLAEVYSNRGNAYMKLNKFDDALQDFNKAIEINDSISLPYYNRSVIYKFKNEIALACYDLFYFKSLNNPVLDTFELETWCNESLYDTVVIGSQTWMSENLNNNRFSNGSIIPEVKSADEWIQSLENLQPAWCYYSFDSINFHEYGKIYNWYAIVDSRILAPKGWHIPDIKEVERLEVSFRSLPDDNTFLGRLNTLGFDAKMGGNITPTGESMNQGGFVAWWTSDSNQENSWNKFSFGWYSGNDTPSEIGKKYGFYVRCIRN
jgi:uncharacterized protein (TIGR02145 family)